MNQQKQQRFSTFPNVLEDSINETTKNRESNLDKYMLPKSHPSNADSPTQSQHQQHRYPVSYRFISKRWAAKASKNWVESGLKCDNRHQPVTLHAHHEIDLVETLITHC